MKQDYSPKQTAAMKARVRRMRAQYRKRMIAAIIIFFILGIVAGIFGYRWFAGQKPDVTGAAAPVQATPEPQPEQEQKQEEAQEPVQTPEAWAMPEDEDGDDGLFAEGDEDDQADAGAEQDAFPEVGGEDDMEEAFAEAEPAQNEGEAEPTEASEEAAEAPEDEGEAEQQAEASAPQQAGAAPGEPLVPQSNGEAEPETDAEAEAEPAAEGETEAVEKGDMGSDEVPEYDPEAADVPEEYLTVPDENGIVEAEAGQALTNYGPQVIAIVPYGESFTYTTEITGDGNARVEANGEPYETVSFTQTMKSYMRPTDFANKYATQYKLQGDEAGAGFELILNDYTGAATIVPQNVIDVSLRSESGNTVERGYQLMDAEIAGNYGVALNTNTPTTLYKRYPYSNTGEEMAYLVVTTYTGGNTQMILFELESDEPEPEPDVIYNILQRGIQSDEVLAMQNRLIELGYLSGNVDGTFGPKTEEAIKAAQAAFGQEQTGIADGAFQQKLFEGEAPNASEATGYVTLSDGSTGDAVKRLQSRLKELGYYAGRIDGGYGPQMVNAVKKAQAAYGMEQTGIADSDFQQKAFEGAATTDTTAADTAANGATLSNGSTGDAVVRLQMALREQGFYTGRADGGYGPNTVASVKKAQAAFGMEQTGIADEAFQQRLFGTGETEAASTEADAASAETETAEAESEQNATGENTVG